MRLLTTDTFIVKRSAKGYDGYDDGKGNWVSSNKTTNTFKAKGSIQPLSGQDVNLLPETFKTTAVSKIYTKTLLKALDQFNGTEADTLVIDDQEYVVLIVEKWRQLHTSHYKVIVGRREKT